MHRLAYSMTTEDGTPVFTGMRESGILPRLAMNIFSDSIHAKLSDLQVRSQPQNHFVSISARLIWEHCVGT